MNFIKSTSSTMSSIVNQGARTLIPVVCSSLIEMSLQDLRIGKIVRGIGLTISGIDLVVNSGTSKNIKSRRGTNNQEKIKSSKILKWGTAAAGLMLAGYGIYNIATGILELTGPNNIHTIIDKAHDSVFSDNNKSTECGARILKAKEQILSCPEGQKLWDEVEAGGSFSIKCATSKEAPSGAMVWAEKREILISEKNEEMVKPLLFELNNLKRAKIAAIIGQNKCGLGVDDYAKAIETVEYGTVKDTYKISKSCIDRGFWSKDLNQFQEAFSGKSKGGDWTLLKGYLETQEKQGHTDLYRMDWYKNCNPQGLLKWMNSNTAKWEAVLAEAQAKKEL